MLFCIYYPNVMKDLIKQKHVYNTCTYKELLVTTKEIFVYLLIIFILIFYYYICMCICTYNFDITNDNYQLSTICNINFEKIRQLVKI